MNIKNKYDLAIVIPAYKIDFFDSVLKSLANQTNKNFTIYVGNEANIIRRKENENVECKIIVPKNSDVIIKGFCFINFKNTCMISLNTKDYEIRPSIVGDYND